VTATRTPARRLISAVTLTGFLLLAAAWMVAFRPQALGGPARYLVIRGDSMVPTYATGDFVVLHTQPTYRIGDIVGYAVPKGEIGAGLLVIHRIIGGDATHGFTVKGDNNRAPDPWRPRTQDIAGSAWVLIPRVGQAIVAIRSPITVAALAAAIVVAVVLFRIPARTRPRDDPRGGTVTTGWRPTVVAAVEAHPTVPRLRQSPRGSTDSRVRRLGAGPDS
jgi:signal peptidase I